MSEIKNIEKVIKKLFDDCLKIEENVNSEMDASDVLRYCETNDRLKTTDDSHNLFAFVKSKVGNEEFIRMIFAIKQGKKKVFNVERVMNMIRCMESVLIYVDSCKTIDGDGVVYLDVQKQI